ncbi:hypothetical protein GCM10009843_02960 [Nocardioides bigeumensis]|uniref:Uncharacterized protein n=1 Tax=Nocardioides bigeumensis TaxID=433657 RepID=A0ABN2XPC2_9ACTN
MVSLTERYNTLLEAELSERLGLAFAERAEAPCAHVTFGRRAVREVVGVDPALADFWSKQSTLKLQPVGGCNRGVRAGTSEDCSGRV